MLSRELIPKQTPIFQQLLTICRNNNKLGNLVHDLPSDASHPLKSSKLASKLGLLLPTTDDRWDCFSPLCSSSSKHFRNQELRYTGSFVWAMS